MPRARMCLRLILLKARSSSFFARDASTTIFSNNKFMDKDYADYLVKKTQEDYNTIAEDFDRTRGRLWEGMERFAAAVDDGDAVLDFGCGNGRLLELFEGKTVDYTGIDQSPGGRLPTAPRRAPPTPRAQHNQHPS